MSEYSLASYCGFPGWLSGKDPLAMQEMQEMIQPLTQKDTLEERMATCSSILAWRIPWTEEPGRLWGLWQSMGSQSQTRLSD